MSNQNPPEEGTPDEGTAPPPPSPFGNEPPPPPPPGYGVPSDQPPTYGGGYPPPPPGDAYGTPNPYATGPDYSPTAAVGWGWSKFSQNVGVLLLTMLAFIVIQVVFGSLERSASSDSNDIGPLFTLNAAGVLVQIVGTIVTLLISAGIVRASLGVTRGESFDIGKVFSADKFVPIVLAAVATSILTAIGLILLILPGLVVIFFTQYVNYFIIDQDQGPIDAIKSSFSFVANNLGPTLLYFLLSIAVLIAGALACLVGLFVAFPVVFLGQAYTYRKLNGQPVSD